MCTSFSKMPGDLKSSTGSRTEKFGEMFPGAGIKDANACLYLVKRLVETSTNEASADDQTN
jgi:hypothetical protein